MENNDTLICSLLGGRNFKWFEDSDEEIESFIKCVDHHGVMPLLHYHLSTTDIWRNCPKSLQDIISNRRKHDVAISMMREQFLASLFAILSEAGINSILLKGEALAYTHYASPELRVRCDTDIFVPVTAITRAIHVLESDGFSISSPRSRYKSHQFTATKPMISGVSYQVDVHWRISNAPAYARIFDYETCLDQSGTIEVSGQECNILHPLHALILACIHLGVQPEEQADRLIWLYDIHLMISQMADEELVEFAKLAVQKGVCEFCLIALERSQQCFETLIPEEVINILRSSDEEKGIKSRFNRSYLALILADIKELPGLSQKWALVSELLFPGNEWLLNKYEKNNVAWVPFLYLRYLGEGLSKRLMLR